MVITLPKTMSSIPYNFKTTIKLLSVYYTHVNSPTQKIIQSLHYRIPTDIQGYYIMNTEVFGNKKIYNSTLSTVEPVYYGHLGTNRKCPNYQDVLIFQVSLYDKAPFGTITKCVDYAGVLITSVLEDNRFHCKIMNSW